MNSFDESFIMGVMKDLIAERDKKQKMQSSIVKWWNVHYMTPEELAEEQEKEAASASSRTAGDSAPSDNADGQMIQEPEKENAADDEEEAAQEILDRLSREAEQDEARKREEIAQARLEAEANYNEATGAYSGGYGASGADGEHKEKIDAILAEKDDALRDLIQRTEED